MSHGRVLSLVLFVGFVMACSKPAPTIPRVSLDFAPSPFPYAPSGLAFQMDGSNSHFTRPLDSAILLEDHSIYLGFVQKRLLVCFRPPDWTAQFFGTEAQSDTNMPGPAQLASSAEGLMVADAEGTQFAWVAKGQTLSTPLDLPKGSMLLGAGYLKRGEPGADWVLRQHEGVEIARYPIKEPVSPRCLLALDGTHLAALDPANGLLSVAEPGHDFKPVLQFPLTLSDGTGIRPVDVKYQKQRFWVLAHQGTGPITSVLLVLDSRATVRSFWKLPYEADRLELNDTYLLLINRATGQAQTHKRD